MRRSIVLPNHWQGTLDIMTINLPGYLFTIAEAGDEWHGRLILPDKSA